VSGHEEDPEDDPVLDDPVQEAFLRRLEAAQGVFLRGLAIGLPLWLFLLLVMGLLLRGPSLGGFFTASGLTVLALVLIERRRGGGRMRLTGRGAIGLLVACVVGLMWLLFVVAVSR
jgi:hypothetical protein